MPLSCALWARLRALCRRSAKPADGGQRRRSLLAARRFARTGRHTMHSGEPLLPARGLTKHFHAAKRLFERSGETVRAVEHVSIDIQPGRTLAVVGESGS